MTAKPLPKGYRLGKSVNKKFVLSDDYEHWTVADLIEMLADYPQEARVWLVSGRNFNKLHPLEMISGSEGEVFL